MKQVILLVLICLSSVLNATCRIMVKIPTRARPDQFFAVLDSYYEKLSHETDCSFLITCDIDDLAMNNDVVRARLRSYASLYFYFDVSESKINAYNRDVDKHSNDFDILVVTSDDMVPNIQGYDKIIADRMVESFPDFDGVLNFSDGFQKFSLNTYPIIGKKYYDRFGFVYNPIYKAGACDQEFTDIAKLLNREVYSDEIIFLHKHPYWFKDVQWDVLYQRNDPPYHSHDKHVFVERKAHKYYLSSDYILKNRLS